MSMTRMVVNTSLEWGRRGPQQQRNRKSPDVSADLSSVPGSDSDLYAGALTAPGLLSSTHSHSAPLLLIKEQKKRKKKTG